MSFASVSSALSSWILALLFGLGPLGAEVLAALGHAQVCACCRTGETVASCCAVEEEENAPSTPEVASLDGACPCAVMTPSSTTPWTKPARVSEARSSSARFELDRSHRVVELAWEEFPWPAATGAFSPAPPGAGSGSMPPGKPGANGGRASALGVLRL